MRVDAGVGVGEVAQRPLGRHDIAFELRLHAAEAFLERRIGRRVPRRRSSEHRGQIGDALARQRVGLHERIDILDAVAIFLLLQRLEEGEHPLPRDPGGGEEARAGGVGGGFLRPAEREILAHAGLLAERHQPRPRLARAGCDGGEAEDHRQKRDVHRGLDAGIGEDDVPVGDVPQFVRDDALHLIGAGRRLQQARMDVDGLAARDEGVDRIVVDQDDLDVARRQARRLDQRRGHVGEHRLRLGIAQDRLGIGRLGGQQHAGGGGNDEALQGRHASDHRRAGRRGHGQTTDAGGHATGG